MGKERVGHISSRDATIACGVCAILGVALTVVVLIGSDIPLKCVEAGAAADWLAAAGTWIIGYGAWLYAKQSHDRNVAELLAGKNARLNLAMSRVIKMTLPVGCVEELLAVDDNERTFSYARSAFTVISGCISDIVWSDGELITFDADLIHQAGAATLAISFLRAEMVRLEERYPGRGDAELLITRDELAALKKEVDRLSGVAEKMKELLRKARGRIQ